MGHVVRCVALSEMLSEHFEILFILQETETSILDFIETNGFKHHTILRTKDYENDASTFVNLLSHDDVAVLDGYHFKTAYQQRIKAAGFQLVAIDDLHAWHQVADVVINHADGISKSEYDCEAYTQLCLGFDYLLLRKAFLQFKKRTKKITAVRKCLISMGAADVHKLTYKFAEALITIPSIEQIVLLVSDVNPHRLALKDLQNQHPDLIHIQQNLSAEMLAEQIDEVDVVICPASSISLEACAVGSIVMSGITAINQKSNLKGLIENDMVIDLDDLNTLPIEIFILKLKSIIDNLYINNHFLQQRKKIDGLSGRRILEIIKNLDGNSNEPSLSCRKADEKDLMLYFGWANDPEVRNNSFDSSPIPLAHHEIWFLKSVRSDSTLMLVFSIDQHPVGQLRFILENSQAILNYSIDRNYRGKGLAQRIINKSIQELRRLKPFVTKVIAEVKPENIASIKSFERIGFERNEISPNKIIYSFVLRS